MSGNDILVSRTSITRKSDVKNLRILFKQYPQIDRWNVDLEDWEKVLRVESHGIPVKVYFGNEKFIDLRVQTRDVKKEIMPFGPSQRQISSKERQRKAKEQGIHIWD